MAKNTDIAKKEILPDSKMPVASGVKNDQGKSIRPIKGPSYNPEAEIKKFGLKPTEVVEYKDPFTQEMKKIMIDRRGTTDEKVALALLDDSVSREQKDSMLSMYLFEKGKQGASMLMDLWAYKGAHTKESRAFQSTMRFDFELFLNAFQMFMRDSHDLLWNNLPLEVVNVEVEEEGKKIKKDIVRVKEGADVSLNDLLVVLGSYARYHGMTAELIGQRIRAEVQKREKSKGKGIYIGMDNKPYSVHEDGDIVEVVQKDREEVKAQRDELVANMPNLCPKAIQLVLEGGIVSWAQFLEEWNKKYPDKSHQKND